MNEDLKPIDSLKPADYNPRTISQHDEISLQNSITEFGDLSGIVNNTTTGNLVGGHQRIKQILKLPAAHVRITMKLPAPDSVGTVALGYVEVDGTDIRLAYREVAWPLEREQAANVAANRIQGEFLLPELAKITEKLKNLYPDLLKLTGQREDEISQLLDQFGSKQESDEQGDVPPVNATDPPKSQRGGIYQLGRHRLMCGDSVSSADVDTLMNGRRAGMVFTDPPYNVAYNNASLDSANSGHRRTDGLTIQNDKMSASDFRLFLDNVCRELNRVCDGAIYICMSPKELGTLKAAFETNGGHWHDYIIWVKDRFAFGGADYQHAYEPILYGWPESINKRYMVPDRNLDDVWEDISAVKTDFDGTHTRIKIQGFEVVIEGKVQGKIKRKKSQSDIWRFNRPSASPEHPTMKPTLLCGEAIKNSSTLEGIVLDLFGGSGSTLIAADETQRTCYMMELDERYVDVIRKRYAKLHDHELDWETFCPPIEAPVPTPTQQEVPPNATTAPTV